MATQNWMRTRAIAAMYRSGHTMQAIGDHYGISRARVAEIIKKHTGITPRHRGRPTANDPAPIADLQSIIPDVNTVGEERFDARISAKSERNKAIGEMYAAGMTLDEIGGHYGLTRERVRQIVKATTSMTAREGGASLRARKKIEKAVAVRNEKTLDRFGCSLEEMTRLREMDREMFKEGKSRYTTLLRAYQNQKRNARERGIDWQFTPQTWWNVWLTSGKWEQRGRGGNNYVMCRFGDIGPYSPYNVYIATSRQNFIDYRDRVRETRKSEMSTMETS